MPLVRVQLGTLHRKLHDVARGLLLDYILPQSIVYVFIVQYSVYPANEIHVTKYMYWPCGAPVMNCCNCIGESY